MIGQLIGPEIHALIEERNFAALKEIFREWPPVDAAELVSELPSEEQVLLFRILPHEMARKVFEYLTLDAQKELLKAMGREQVAQIVNEMSPDDRTALFEELPAEAVRELIRLLNPQERQIAQCLLNYPEESIGRVMTPDFVAVHDEWSVEKVLNYIREHGQDRETLNVLYVVDEGGKLIDDVRIREVLLRPPSVLVRDFRDNTFVALKVTDLEKDAVAVFRKYDRTALPVIDSDGVLVGIVTIDDVLDIAEKEATDEIQKLGGSEALDEPYSTIPFFRMVRKRGTWLVMLFLGEMLTATAMGYFEVEIEKAVVLALFLPLIISSGGNSGSQASTLIIRAMALGEVKLSDWWRVMRKEIFAGLTLGAVLGSIGFLRIAGWSMFSDVYGRYWLLVALTVSLSLVGVVLWGSLSGSMLPFVLRRCKVDPANSSAPFVATLVDVTGLIIYFTIAMLVLRSTLLAPSDSRFVKLGQERTTRAFDHLLAVNKQWETREVELRLPESRLVFYLGETDELAASTKCPKCGGEMAVNGHQKSARWPYPKVLQWQSEIRSELPVLKCKKCRTSIEATPPLGLSSSAAVKAS